MILGARLWRVAALQQSLAAGAFKRTDVVPVQAQRDAFGSRPNDGPQYQPYGFPQGLPGPRPDVGLSNLPPQGGMQGPPGQNGLPQFSPQPNQFGGMQKPQQGGPPGLGNAIGPNPLGQGPWEPNGGFGNQAGPQQNIPMPGTGGAPGGGMMGMFDEGRPPSGPNLHSGGLPGDQGPGGAAGYPGPGLGHEVPSFRGPQFPGKGNPGGLDGPRDGPGGRTFDQAGPQQVEPSPSQMGVCGMSASAPCLACIWLRAIFRGRPESASSSCVIVTS
jgi:hypothetical protein